MRIAFGRFARVSMGIKSRRRAFSLVELLVVLGIIVLLMGILLPVLSRVRETGRRAKCAANLHSIGQACIAFANDHNGIFPACYRMIDTGGSVYPYRIPNFIAYPNANANQQPNPALDHDMDNNALTGWQSTGSSWRMFLQYTAAAWKTDQVDLNTKSAYNLSIFTCPSCDTPARWIDYTTTSPAYPQYGSVIDTNYMYLGGLSDSPNPTVNPPLYTTALGNGSMSPQKGVQGSNQSRSHWGTLPPATQTLGSPLYGLQSQGTSTVLAITLGYARTSSCILAADMVYFSGVNYPDPTTHLPAYRINHPQQGNPKLPDFQNVLYADGRVEGLARDSYAKPLYDDSGVDPTGAGATITPSQFNYSLKFSDTAGGYYYWGEGSATPAPDLTFNATDVFTSVGAGPGLGPIGARPQPPPPNIQYYNPPPVPEGSPPGNAP